MNRQLQNSSSDIYSRCWVNFTLDTVVTEIPNFMNMGLSDVQTLNKIGSFSIPATKIVRPTDGSNWLPSGHLINEVTVDKMSETRSEQNYNSKTDFETRRENKDSEWQIFL